MSTTEEVWLKLEPSAQPGGYLRLEHWHGDRLTAFEEIASLAQARHEQLIAGIARLIVTAPAAAQFSARGEDARPEWLADGWWIEPATKEEFSAALTPLQPMSGAAAPAGRCLSGHARPWLSHHHTAAAPAPKI